jgi:hypothetical protein
MILIQELMVRGRKRQVRRLLISENRPILRDSTVLPQLGTLRYLDGNVQKKKQSVIGKYLDKGVTVRYLSLIETIGLPR